jgi:hypothetical protein
MHEPEPVSLSPAADRPRHAHHEVVDLLAAALLRLRGQHQPPSDSSIAADWAFGETLPAWKLGAAGLVMAGLALNLWAASR